MKKLVELLEKRVEWIVLGLGVVWVILMAYSYLWSKPMVSGIANEPLPPGDVDQAILTNQAADLQAKIERSATTQPIKPPDFVQPFLASMSYANDPVKPWDVVLVNHPRTPMIKLPESPALGGLPQVAGGAAPAGVIAPNAPVAALPTVPQPTIEKLRTGLTNVQLTSALTNPQPVPGAQAVDKSWNLVMFKIDGAALASAWDASKIPDPNANTTFLIVNIERQELQPNGQWGPATPVSPLPITATMPFPGPNATPMEQQGYAVWASQHVVDILRPGFYTKVQGDEWTFLDTKPNQPGGAPAGTPVFDPAQHMSDTPAQLLLLTLEQRQLVSKYREQQRQQQRPTGRNTGPGRRGSTPVRPTPRGGIDRPTDVVGPDFAPNDMRPNPEDLPQSGPDVINPYDIEAPLPGQGMGVPNVQLPAGEVNPRQWAQQQSKDPGIYGWITDENVMPGHTYRYRATYKIKNPVFLSVGVTKDPKLATVFALTSQPSAWSEPVEVASTISFFVTKTSRMANVVSVDVFRLQGGQVMKRAFDVAPGDAIGAPASNADFTTGWTMLDVRLDSRTQSPYVLLLSPEGTVERRDITADANDQRYKKLDSQAQATAAASAAVQ